MGVVFDLFAMADYEYAVGVSTVQGIVAPPTKLSKVKGGAILLPVNSDLWLGGPVGKIVRDVSGDYVQDQARKLAPLPGGQAVAVRSNRGPTQWVILANIYDDNKLTSEANMARAFDAAFQKANEIGADTLVIPDFTDEFNYFTHRADFDVIVRAIVGMLKRNQERGRTVRVVLDSKEKLDQFKAALEANV